jgi:hypothetical protein
MLILSQEDARQHVLVRSPHPVKVVARHMEQVKIAARVVPSQAWRWQYLLPKKASVYSDRGGIEVILDCKKFDRFKDVKEHKKRRGACK